MANDKPQASEEAPHKLDVLPQDENDALHKAA